MMEKIFDCPGNVFVVETNDSKSVIFKLKSKALEKEFNHGYIYDTTTQKLYLIWNDGIIESSFEKGRSMTFVYGDKYDKYISILIDDKIRSIDCWEKDDRTVKNIYNIEDETIEVSFIARDVSYLAPEEEVKNALSNIMSIEILANKKENE